MKIIIPTHGKILVEERLTREEIRTKAGIIVPESAKEKIEKPSGVIVAVANPVRTIKGDLIEPDSKVGDIAFFAKTTRCIPIESEGKNCLLVPVADVYYYERKEDYSEEIKLAEEEYINNIRPKVSNLLSTINGWGSDMTLEKIIQQTEIAVPLVVGNPNTTAIELQEELQKQGL